MFSHIQTTSEGKFLRKIPAGELIVWDASNYCTAFALEKDGKAEQFRVLPFYSAGEPSHDPITQNVREIDPAPVDGLWTQQWEVVSRFVEYTDEQGVTHTVAEQEAEAIAADQVAKAAAAREEAKRKRAEAVANIKVTTAAGNTFDGDEDSQGRMSRAILGLLSNQTEASGAATIPWVLADNTVIQADAAELTEAMTLAGLEQARLWVIE